VVTGAADDDPSGIATYSIAGAQLGTGLLWTAWLTWPLMAAVQMGKEAWAMLVAILGTTISPYLFFWQASQEVEEEKAMGRRMLVSRQGATSREIADRNLDVGFGTFASNLVMFFVILTTALTLHVHGATKIENTRQAAEALRPLAGSTAALLFTVGILGVGFLAIPTLSGSAGYAFAETFHWRQGLDQKLARARGFYFIVILSTAAGIAIDFADVNPIRVLVISAVVNGLLAPFLLVGILIVASDRKLMKGQPSSPLGRAAVGLTLILMGAAGIGMFLF
jgi:Mn2+/Fe2+ NRAMP family transporter